MSAALASYPRFACREGGALVAGERILPVETAVAFHYNGRSHAVMMATPNDLEDFAVGFSITESLIHAPADIAGLEIRHRDDAIELHMQVPGRVRGASCQPAGMRLTGPSGCGLCGVTCIDDALRPIHLMRTRKTRLDVSSVAEAMRALQAAQTLNGQAKGLHAAGFWRPGQGLVAVREDIGRHCALDKLTGALARSNVDAAGGAVLLTSRVSVELVQKTARLGACMILAVSVPTALAVRKAEEAGITLVAVVRGDDLEVFTRPERIACTPERRVARE